MAQTKKVSIALILLSVFALWLGQKLGDRQGLLIAFFATFALNSYIYYFFDRRILKSFRRKEIEGHDPWGILNSLEDLCKKAHIPMPRVFISPFQTPTSVSIAKNWKQSYIILSEKLVENFSKEDLKAVLALEVAKIKRLDTLALGILSSLFSMWFYISMSIDKILFLQVFVKKEKRTYPLTFISLPFLKIIYSLCIPEQSCYKADKYAAEIYHDNKQLAKILWKLESYASTQAMMVPLDMAHLFIINPLPKSSWYQWLQYQPNYEKRIKKLVGYFPI